LDNNKYRTIFKRCSCGSEWKTLDEFISDKNLTLSRYQVNFKNIDLGILLFNHKDCGSTIGVNAYKFKELHSGPIFRVRLTGENVCPGYCFHVEEISPCPNPCECSWIRDVMQIIKTKKLGEVSSSYVENSIYVKKFTIPSFGIDHKGKLKVTYLMNLLQEMAGIHAGIFHYSYEDLIKRGFTWVLSRYRIRFYSYPAWKDKILIYTWNSEVNEKFAVRDYEVVTEKGILVALSSTSWALLDIKSKRVVGARKIIPDNTVVEKITFPDGFSDISGTDSYDFEREFPVSIHDVDLNRHVNNVVYVDWLLRSMPDDFLKKYQLYELNIDYKNEAYAGDNVLFRMKALENNDIVNVSSIILKKDKLSELVRARFTWRYVNS